MNCDSFTKAIPLYFYGELSPEQEDRLEEHLENCSSCRTQAALQQRLAQKLHQREIQPDDALLAECRQELAHAVHRQTSWRSRNWQPWLWLEDLFRPLSRLRQPVGAMALVALGFACARWSVTGPAAGLSSFTGGPVIASVRSVQPDSSGRIQIGLEETRRRVVSGRLEDGNIQELLLVAAREEGNPGVRVDSLDALKNSAASQAVRAALLDAVQHDPNPGVRLKALEGLKPFSSDAEVRKALAQALLRDENSGVRIQVIDLLTAHRDDSTVGVLQNLVTREQNGYVRSRCRKALEEMNASVGTF